MFNSLESLNVAIFESLSAFNGRRMNGRSLSRREQIEAEYLRPLPAIRHQMKERRSATVMRNCYVTFKLHHYSMPKEYIGKRVEIVYDADTLEIYHGLRLVTTHQRDDTPYSYTTKDAHGLPGRHGSYEKDLEQIYERAGQTDNVLLLYLRKVAELKKYPPRRSVHAEASWRWRRPRAGTVGGGKRMRHATAPIRISGDKADP